MTLETYLDQNTITKGKKVGFSLTAGVSLSKTIYLLLSTGSTQEDLSRHD